MPSPICLGFAPMTSRCLGGRADLCRVGGEGAISWDFDSARCLGEPLLVDSFLKTIRYGEAQKKVHSLGWAKTVPFEISLVLYRTPGMMQNKSRSHGFLWTNSIGLPYSAFCSEYDMLPNSQRIMGGNRVSWMESHRRFMAERGHTMEIWPYNMNLSGSTMCISNAMK